MHPKDQMTPNERMGALFAGEPLDRLPMMPFVISYSPRVLNQTQRWYRESAENRAACQIAAYEKWGHDTMVIEYSLHGVSHALGSTWTDPENAQTAIDKHRLDDLDDVDGIDWDIDAVRKENDPWMQMNVDAAQICLDRYGDEVGVSVTLPGAMTAASGLYPVAQLLRAKRKQPEQLHKLLKICNEAIKLVCEEFIKLGATPFLCDPVASGTIINEKEFREFSLPYTQEVFKFCHDNGGGCGYHICGDTTKLTQAMSESGCDMLSVDDAVDLSYVKEVCGDKLPLIGNVSPNATMMLGTPEDVRRNIKENLKKAYDSPCGYIVATGCDIPLPAPIENVDAFMDGVRELARYPFDPEKWA
ncbi:Uroporphyrinogen decarboxylase [Slackia heliotrinireducens]|uniref:uroporphyrinogen decarboxylase family protein n=1 Tax=Slackia heliotrinireducens TaxID=84110 RepID=UPI00022513BA|nr:uroporphyrinogen decarboxylase family protein [Slackia heliotrinireducens]VEH03052.1 Uroporphyrinogen decarboxylase [Slackia heliotrinireducens]